MLLLSVLKICIAFTAFGVTAYYLISGMANNDKIKLRKAAVIFFSAFILLLLISALDFF